MSIEEKLTNAEAFHLAIDEAQVHILDKDSNTRRLYTLGGVEANNNWTGNQTFSGSSTFSGALTFSGNPSFSGTPSFTGNPSFSGNPSFTGNPTVSGDLTVSGDFFDDSPGAPSRPTTAAEMNTAISGGSKYVSFKYITTIDVNVRVPYGVSWDPPKVGSPLTFTGGKLVLDGPAASQATWQIFDTTTVGDVRGAFGGLDISAGWWAGFDPDAIANFGPYLVAAASSRHPGTLPNATVTEWNDKLTQVTLGAGGDITGGRVIVPAGLWTVTTEMAFGSKYVFIEGIPKATGIQFKGMGDEAGFKINGPVTNTIFRHLHIFIEIDCHDNFDLFEINSGFTEGVIFEYLEIRGCERHIWHLLDSSGSTNHFTIQKCHILAPNKDGSTCLYGRSGNNRFVWTDNTLAQGSGAGDGYWDIGIDLSGYDRVEVSNSHFESQRVACVRVSDLKNVNNRYNGVVELRNITHNYNNSFWDILWFLSESTTVDVGKWRPNNNVGYRCIFAHIPVNAGSAYEPGVGGSWTNYWALDDGGAILYCHKDSGASVAPSYGINASGLTAIENFVLIKDDAFLGTVRSGGNTDLDSSGHCRQTKNGSRRVVSYTRSLDSYDLHTTNPTADVATSGEHTASVADDPVALAVGLYEVVPTGSFGGGTLTVETADNIIQPGFSAISAAVTRTIFHPGGNALVTLAGATNPELTVTFTRVHNL